MSPALLRLGLRFLRSFENDSDLCLNEYVTQILEEIVKDCREDNGGGYFKEQYYLLMSRDMYGKSNECLIDMD